LMLNLDVRNKFPPAFPPETNVIYIYVLQFTQNY
jgi:hypothetical protein